MTELSSEKCIFCDSHNVTVVNGCFRDIITDKRVDNTAGLVCSDCGKTTIVTYTIN